MKENLGGCLGLSLVIDESSAERMRENRSFSFAVSLVLCSTSISLDEQNVSILIEYEEDL